MTSKEKMRMAGSIVIGVTFGVALPLGSLGGALVCGGLYLLFSSI
jgi:hypothetical protein